MVPWVSKVKQIFERSEALRAIFPEIEPDASWWRENSFRLKGEPLPSLVSGNVEGIGVGGEVTGRGYDVVKFDDIVNYQNSSNPQRIEAICEYHRSMQPILALGLEFVMGTMWNYDDLYNRLIKSGDYDLMRFGWQGTDGHSRFPEQYPDERMMELKKRLGTRQFAFQYENEPTPGEDAFFREEWIKTYVRLPEKVKFDVLAAVDPSPGLKQGDPSGIAIVGIDQANDDWYVLHSESYRYNMEQLGERICNLHKAFHPRKWLVESNGTQAYLRTEIDRVRKNNKMFLPMTWSGSESYLGKEARIASLVAKFEFGNLYLRPQDVSLRKELRYWPNWKTDDVLDALAYIGYLRRSKRPGYYVPADHRMPPAITMRDVVTGKAPANLNAQGWL